MRFNKPYSLCNHKSRCGFSLVEVAVSILLVGVLMVASLQSLSASKRREGETVDRLVGQQLSSAMINEILLQAYKEPDTSAALAFGPELGESTGNRSLFDDVDDYAAYTSTPPKDRSGATIPGLDGWTHSVNVTWADPLTLAATSSINTGLKRIEVTASKNGQVRGSIVGYRSIGWVDTIPTPDDATGNHAPVAVAVSPDLTRKVGESVLFFAYGSTDEDDDYLSYVWDFGDGTTGTSAWVVHSYSSAGTFTCTLTVYDGRGGVATSAVTAVIAP